MTTAQKQPHELLAEMFATQDRLNTYLDPEWKTKPETYQNPWAIFDEAAEILNGTNWKWWSKAKIEPNVEQLQLEVVDIWMFLMGEIQYLHGALNADVPEDITDSKYKGYSLFLPTSCSDFDEFALRTFALGLASHCINREISDPGEMLNLFSGLVSAAGMSLEDLYTLYNQKAALNLFRWEMGYGTTYRKQWGAIEGTPPEVKSEEDNVWLMRVVKQFPEAKDVDSLLEILRKTYYVASRCQPFGAVAYGTKVSAQWYKDVLQGFLPSNTYIKKPILIKYRIAKEAFTLETLEGPLAVKVGDIILTGTKGEEWVVSEDYLLAMYHVCSDSPGLKFSRPGATGNAVPKPNVVSAQQMLTEFTVKTADNHELKGKAGDYRVCDTGDSWVVDKDIFEEKYVLTDWYRSEGLSFIEDTPLQQP